MNKKLINVAIMSYLLLTSKRNIKRKLLWSMLDDMERGLNKHATKTH